MDLVGKPFQNGYKDEPPKNQNSTIHLLEAFTELHKVWPDKQVENRLKHLYFLIKDTIIQKNQYMHRYFYRDWSLVSYRDSLKNDSAKYFSKDHISFGHDVETAYLLHETAERLDLKREPVLKLGKSMVDHSIENGWDTHNGGLYEAGYYLKNGKMQIVNHAKSWWTQAEAMNTFLLMEEHFPNAKHNYYQYFLDTWQYTQKYLIDSEYGGWFPEGTDQNHSDKNPKKANPWKGAYHNTRALINCIEKLESDHFQTDHH